MNTAWTLSCSAREQRRDRTEMFGSPSVTGDTGSSESAVAAPSAATLLAGPAAAPARGRAAGAERFTLTERVASQSAARWLPSRPAEQHRADQIGVNGQIDDTRPSSRAVNRCRSAVHACAHSCTVRENNRTMNSMKIRAKSRYRARSAQVTADSRKTQERHRRFADPAASSSRGAPHANALPNFVSSAFRRRRPTPGTSSSSERRSRIARACR